MKKPQWILSGVGIALLLLIYFFGNTVPPAKKTAQSETAADAPKVLDISDILRAEKSKLSPARQSYVERLEHSVVRGDVHEQQRLAYRQLAAFWKDSVENGFLPSAYYIAEAAKLENSEKSLTFAAQLFLNNLRGQDNPAIKNWMADQSRTLFETVLKADPSNDSAKVGLGATYIFGGGSGDPTAVMKGIQQILEVTRRDSMNMYAQFMLGLGGIESGQLDKAVIRLSKVVAFEPGNLEAVLNLAEAYERNGDKTSAVKWYTNAKKLTNNQDLITAIEERLKSLK